MISSQPSGKHICLLFWALIIGSILVVVVGPLLGKEILPLDVFTDSSHEQNSHAIIYWKIRLPRVLLAFLAGAGLSVSGMVFQAIFRNPLATPFTLGVASGASLGAACYVKLGVFFSFFGISGMSLFSLFGALLSIFIVYGLSVLSKGFSTVTILLAGVALSFFFSSLILFTQYLSDFTQSYRIMRWLMGGLEVVGFESLLNILPFIVTGCVIVVSFSNELNLLMSGEDIAISRGVDTKQTKKVLFFATSLMVGAIVSVCGPIGFVGMMSPHICRLLVGAEHRLLAPASMLFGGCFLAICDILARTIISPAEIPVGIITALLGGPFFLRLLVRDFSSFREDL